MQLNISINNSKLGPIPSVNLPPVITCRSDAPCVKSCYARRGHFLYNNVKSTMIKNLELYKKDPDLFFAELESFLNQKIIFYKYFRFHAAGDLVDQEYFIKILELAKKIKNTTFLLFSKKFEIINKVIEEKKPPKNIKIVLSAWRGFYPLNPHGLPVAYINDCENIPNNAIKCGGYCESCLKCFNIKNGQSILFKKH